MTLPFLPALAVGGPVSVAQQQAARARQGIPEQFMLYPAAFWPHKNHARIVEAIERLARVRDLRLHAVFCGSRGDAERERQFQLVMEMATRCGVADLIHVPGYVSDTDLAALYSCATALVMPTFFGPTNIPVLEAWAHGCPVLTSDIPGIREQAGDAAILVEPRDVDALATGMQRLATDAALRRDLIARGTRRLAEYTPRDFEDRLCASLLRGAGLAAPPSATQRA